MEDLTETEKQTVTQRKRQNRATRDSWGDFYVSISFPSSVIIEQKDKPHKIIDVGHRLCKSTKVLKLCTSKVQVDTFFYPSDGRF